MHSPSVVSRNPHDTFATDGYGAINLLYPQVLGLWSNSTSALISLPASLFNLIIVLNSVEKLGSPSCHLFRWLKAPPATFVARKQRIAKKDTCWVPWLPVTLRKRLHSIKSSGDYEQDVELWQATMNEVIKSYISDPLSREELPWGWWCHLVLDCVRKTSCDPLKTWPLVASTTQRVCLRSCRLIPLRTAAIKRWMQVGKSKNGLRW